MPSSTVSLQSVIDNVTSQGVPSPLDQPSGFGEQLALDMANDVMGDLIAERFNWKWNSQVAAPFYTNSWQQDYPQVGLVNMDWGEQADRIDINNTSYPLPLFNMTWRKQLSRTSYANGVIGQVCWMYNKDLSTGVWPGAGKTYFPLAGTNPTAQNPIMAIKDANGNILVVTTFGTTGNAAPVLAAGAAEGATVNDGSVVWTVAGPLSQGFRVFGMPSATGPVWQIIATYQMIAPTFSTLQQMLDPIPDNYARFFRRGYYTYCLKASPNPNDRRKFEAEHAAWLMEMQNSKKQGDRELNSYGLLPATSPVESIYGRLRNPQDPSEPY
jgi:hypothetical protein